MAGFKTHITTSTVLGIGYGAAGYFGLEMPLATCMLSAGLCSVAGMLPDLDSNSGVPVRELMAFVAAGVPMLMLERFQTMGLSRESMALAGLLIYLLVRFGVAELFKRYTKHRGMWHSLPAAAIVGLLAYLVVSGDVLEQRLFKSLAVVAGFLSHLVVDELWSVEWRRGRVQFKRSFGTALKLWGPSLWGNVSTYGKLAVVTAVVFVCDPVLMNQFRQERQRVEYIAEDVLQRTMR